MTAIPGDGRPDPTLDPATDSVLDGRPSWAADVVALITALESLGELPYDPTPSGLYQAEDLYRGFESGGFSTTVDQAVYDRARHSGSGPIQPLEALAQRLHDHGITIALDEYRAGRRLAGVMGGHALQRGSDGYRQAVALGRAIAGSGRCAVTGGGPGAMEAANLGARSAGVDESTVESMMADLAKEPSFGGGSNDGDDTADRFIEVSLEVAAALPNDVDSLSVPTWFYGHEPSNPFATAIAKYFSNSEREDGLLAIALSGIVFLAGGPGTMQEVFQDAAQNAYRTFGHPSPMVFLDPPGDRGYWRRTGVMDALDTAFTAHDGGRRPGWELVTVVTSVDEAVAALA